MDDKRLFLLDAYALIYRAYYALVHAPRVTSKGFNTSAIFGFCNTLDEILRKERPTHIAVCFDPKSSSTFRHEMYPQYKAQRQAQPEDITLSIPYIKEILAAYNIPVIEIEGYEADDVIGTIAKKASSVGFTTYMMTPDKDYGQLVTDNVLMYRPALRGRDFEIRGPQQVCERYGLKSPRQVIDLLALEGDASDNIPGCPGVGEKTAVKLIGQYGSVENLIVHAAEIPGAIGNKIRANIPQIELSKRLATICTDVPVDIDPDSLARRDENPEELRRIFTELEFRTFLTRLGAADIPSPEALPKPAEPSLFDFAGDDTAAQTAPSADVSILTTEAEVALFVERATARGEVGMAVYAPGADAMNATLQGIALSIGAEEGETVFIPFDSQSPEQNAAILATIAPMMVSENVVKVSHDVKRDMVVLRCHEIFLGGSWFDTSVAHYILQPEMRHRLSDVALSMAAVNTLEATEPPARSKTPWPQYAAGDAPRRMAEYARIPLLLKPILEKKIEENEQTPLLRDIELPMVAVLADMEFTGVRIDREELAALSVRLTLRLHQMEEEAYTLAGQKFNIGSPRQVGDILFDRLAIDPKAKRTKTGAYSTTEEILESYRAAHPIVDLILKIRALSKLLTTYINALPALVNPRTGKIHTTFNQTVTATGRISSANPNLQNIPVRTDDGREIRRAFIADPGDLILSADYSQIELRLMADLSADPSMVQAFLDGQDIHQATAAKIYHLPLDQVTPEQRRNAKTANFGIIYGISAFGLSQRLGIPRAEAKELIDGYFRSYPDIERYIADVTASAHEKGYVATRALRRRYLPDINSRNASLRAYAERNAVNAPLQGSAADIIKIAMVSIFRRLEAEGFRSKMIMQVHDELIFNVVPDELPRLQALVTQEMRSAYSGRVPMEVSSGVATNWLEAH